ncbi:MAG: hypothetical protein HC906_12535 [Bacteroidales bacterium]|nr:hypothetical protein [Bacteroidales bacterium]
MIGFENGLGSKAYSGLGAGVRLRNERLIFNTLQIRLAFYPVVPNDAKYQVFQLTGEERLRFENFYISSPEIIGKQIKY